MVFKDKYVTLGSKGCMFPLYRLIMAELSTFHCVLHILRQILKNEFTFYHNIQMFYIILTCFKSYV